MTLVYCACGELAVALVGEHIALCLTHYADILELATARVEARQFRPLETVTTGGVL